jgi:4-alpha-glucanotransferase
LFHLEEPQERTEVLLDGVSISTRALQIVMSDWAEQTARFGVEPSYYDVKGRQRVADPEVLRRVVEALSASGQSATEAGQASDLQPSPAYQGDGRRVWILAVQLYAVRSRRNWGHGDFTDLAALLELTADVGGAGVGLNPLHALFYDRPGSGSPYSPNSRLFVNPLYIDVEAVPEFRRTDMQGLARKRNRLRATEFVDYSAVARLKLAALRAAYGRFCMHGSPDRREAFDGYCQDRGVEFQRFAAFETLRRRYRGPWWEWPKPWRKPDEAALRSLREAEPLEFGFQQFLQWNAETQLQRCTDIARNRGMSIGLYLDTAVGVDLGGADAWMAQGAILQGLSIGAPPDQFNPAGQDWGITAYNPHGLAESGYQPFREMLSAAMRHAGAVRLDHVLGLMRLFVIPRGLSAEQGVYLRSQFAAMLEVVREESLRWKCIVVGEDLGTVPENFRETLASWGLWSYLVTLFEREHDGSFRRPENYPERAIATFNTHDLATFNGWMSAHDLKIKQAIGIDPGETVAERDASRARLVEAVGGRGNEIQFTDVVSFLAAAPTKLVSIAIEDVLGVVDQINMPGTVTEHPNWRRRLPVPLEEFSADQRLRRVAATLARAGRGSTVAAS